MTNETFFQALDNRTQLIPREDFNIFINQLLFIILICISIPSVLINLFATYRLHGNTKLSVFAFRCILHVSLLTTCLCIPFFVIQLYLSLSSLICQIWLIIDYSAIVCLALLVCWASIQRHILIFGPLHLRKLQSTLNFKLIPSIFALGFPLVWYSILILSCPNKKLTTTTTGEKFRCRPCFEDEKLLFLIDTLFSLLLPLSITIIATLILLIRIIRLRFRLFRSNSKKWRRCKRLTRQMILFSLIYLFGLLPYVLTTLNSLYQFWPLINLTWCIQIANAFTYIPCCFSSFISIYAFPEIWTNHRRTRSGQKTLRTHRKHEQTSAIFPSMFLSTKTSTET